MTDVVLNPISSGYNLSTINENFVKVRNVINNEVVHLTGGNNLMLQNLDMNGNAILNLMSDPNNPDSMATIADIDALANRAVRAPVGESIAELPPISSRANKVMGFDSLGSPIGTLPATGSGTELALDLANPSDMSKGISMVKGGIREVDSIATLKTLPKTGTKKAFVSSYYAGGTTGGGIFTLDLVDTTSADNGVTTIVASDGGRWKLYYGDTLYIEQTGATPGQDIADKLNLMGSLLFDKLGGVIKVAGMYTFGSQVNAYPNVHLKGAGSGRGTRITVTHTGSAVAFYRPDGYVPLCIGSRVSGFTFIGPSRVVSNCIQFTDCMQCEVFENEITNFATAFLWNKDSTASSIKQSFFNKVYQNMVKPCTIGHYFGGAANRNFIDTNTYADCDVAYDFSATDNYSETNTFLNENIEGCHSWAEWGLAVYSQTWVGICIENPSTNGYVCTVKDPGRQVFLNLSLIPLGDEAAITKYELTPNNPSMVLGSAASSGTNRLGLSVTEALKMYSVQTHYTHTASQVFTGTINAGTSTTISIPLTTALLNDRVDCYALRSLGGCTLQAYSDNGSVSVVISNGLSSNVSLTNVEISVILKRVGI